MSAQNLGGSLGPAFKWLWGKPFPSVSHRLISQQGLDYGVSRASLSLMPDNARARDRERRPLTVFQALQGALAQPLKTGHPAQSLATPGASQTQPEVAPCPGPNPGCGKAAQSRTSQVPREPALSLGRASQALAISGPVFPKARQRDELTSQDLPVASGQLKPSLAPSVCSIGRQ